MPSLSQEQIVALRDKHEHWLMSQPGVTGTSVGLKGNQIVLRVFTHGIQPPIRKLISSQLSGVPLDWEEGEIVAQ